MLSTEMIKMLKKYDQRDFVLHKIMRKELEKKLKNQPGPSSSLGPVTIISPTNKPIYLENMLKNYLQQNYLEKELIIILNNDKLELEEWKNQCKHIPNVRVFQLSEKKSLGDCINFGVENATGKYIAKFDDDDYYGPNYLLDMIHCFSFTDASVVGKASHFVYFEGYQKLSWFDVGSSYQYVYHLPGGTHVIKRETFQKIKFPSLNVAEDLEFNKACLKAGLKLYSADPFNFLRIRKVNKKLHTWRIADDLFIQISKFLTKTDNPTPLITV